MGDRARSTFHAPIGDAAPAGMALDPFYRLIHLAQTVSTNDDAARMASAGAAEGTVVWADSQSAGRGRRGRHWQSPPGNLYCSVILRPDLPIARAGQVGFAAALAIVEAATWLVPKGIRIACKWPNDVLVGGRKVAGLLLETSARSDGVTDWLVLGVGINVARYPEQVEFPATSLAACGARTGVEEVLTLFCRHFHAWYQTWRGAGFAPLRNAWLQRAAGLDQPIRVRLENRTLEGTFSGLDEEGALLLHSAGAAGAVPLRVTAGDVFFPAETARIG